MLHSDRKLSDICPFIIQFQSYNLLHSIGNTRNLIEYDPVSSSILNSSKVIYTIYSKKHDTIDSGNSLRQFTQTIHVVTSKTFKEI